MFGELRVKRVQVQEECHVMQMPYYRGLDFKACKLWGRGAGENSSRNNMCVAGT